MWAPLQQWPPLNSCCVADSRSSKEKEEGLLFKEASPRDPVVYLFPHGQWRPLHRLLLHSQVGGSHSVPQMHTVSWRWGARGFHEPNFVSLTEDLMVYTATRRQAVISVCVVLVVHLVVIHRTPQTNLGNAFLFHCHCRDVALFLCILHVHPWDKQNKDPHKTSAP